MARPLRIDYPDAYYHVTCRGNERKDIFKDDRDRNVFLEKLQASLEIYSVRLHAYVLMTNHFHLVCQTPKANLSSFMRHFNVSYTAFYNRRHARVGHLYQGRFRAILVEADSYLLELSRYVHLNPVRVASMQKRGSGEQLKYLRKYYWSSLEGYLTQSRAKPWVVYEEVLGYVGGSRKGYGQFIEEGLAAGYGTPWEDLRGQVVLGSEGFWERVKGKWSRGSFSVREQPSVRVLQRVEPEKVLGKGAAYFKLRPEELRRKRSGYRDQRALLMEMLHRYSEVSQQEIGRHMGGMDYTAVSHERGRVRQKMVQDAKLRRWARDLESLLIT
jgi:REP element-mobilizing transposase RayT